MDKPTEKEKRKAKQIYEFCETHTLKDAELYFGLGERSIRRYRAIHRNDALGSKSDEPKKITFTQDKNLGYVSGQAKSLEELLKKAGVDLRIWEVETFEIKDSSWDVTMKNIKKDITYKDGKKKGVDKQTPGGDTVTNKQYYIKARLKKRTDYIEIILPDLIKDIGEYQFTHYIPKHNKGTGIALEMGLLDAHLGKLAWMSETGYRNYDLQISAEDYVYAVDKVLNWSSTEKLEKMFYIVGQDMFHVDNLKNHTTSGEHAMDVDGRLPKVIRKAQSILFESIHRCREVSPVEIIWSPGNHDSLQSLNFCLMLEQYFKDDKFVTVDVDKNPGFTTRKARLWGNLLVGWTHRIVGKENTWGNELAQAFPELWGQSKLREWHCGDQHKHKVTKTMPEFTSGGVLIRQLTALSPVDKWHFENVFTDAVPGGEAFLWSKDNGVFTNYTAWTSQYELFRNELMNKK